ncbi:aminotransferase class IV [Pontibacter chinhatensis]|uniref:branched-chain-amino-acid transaminase n=1 Tax=Pontibacter chinhatensis TaxID=1436961 RepID=A0A1I2M2S7_9BACT|nr:aminotransferase class IV [Pontibacter chinhatensis]SFF85098.1 branched-chain amino acid aminotransferase/4-amino-4-deoxychorismate lyase [Pontibacter chinhatensis]
MFILYNNQQLPESELRLPLHDRAFQYNDGFFETAILQDGRIRLWHSHLERIWEAAQALQLELPSCFYSGELEAKLLELVRQQGAANYGRLKLKVWRAGAGLYTPQTSQVNWLATAAPTSPAADKPLRLGICQHVRTSYTSLSHFKGPNAPLYVMAGLEKQEHDDMLLLSPQGKVAELISSNIFWLKEGVLYTPELSTGCVNGILRRNILAWCSGRSIAVQQVQHNPEELYLADAIFAANVTGIRAVASINGRDLPQQAHFMEELRNGLQI